MSTITATTELLTLVEAAKIAPGQPHASTVWRWCRRGIKSRTGARIRLAHQRYGRTVFVTRAALEQFGRELADADADHFGAPSDQTVIRSPAARLRSSSRAEAELASAGW